MSALFSTILFLAAASGSGSQGGFAQFYNEWLNIPGFELWKFLNLAIFVGIIVYIAKKPLSAAFKAKREAIRVELIRAEEEKQAALARLADAEAKLTRLEAEKAEILKKAATEAEAEKRRLAEATEAEIQRVREQANAEIARVTQAAKAELRRYSAEESIRLAEEKLKAQIDTQKDAQLVKANIESIGGLN